ncbi:hypothetical protein FOZ76_14595 [Verticiella sediminum]|uniref:Uncharacterized protein n=1 Tax=Verticiella sediminum TaxID=1247510 RepID=A0A556AIF2_9BURK|nr:hypothetical protein [Verticiella sediminum]TSH92646.1 hypothetical protein FOZ76_14595 [Verticiella sediminum]
MAQYGTAAEYECQTAGIAMSLVPPSARALNVRAAWPREEQGVQEAMRDSDLLDPFSVQLRRLRVGDLQAAVVMCGEFNAKNAYGAYMGFQPFIGTVMGDHVRIDRLGHEPRMAQLLNEACLETGLTPTPR